mgnify:CR=1 FL=1
MYKIIMFLICFFTTFGVVFSQKSDEIISQEGKQFYVHIVQPGNSLYGLYRLYNVSIDDIKNINPGLGEELKEGQKVLIPMPEVNSVQKEKKVILHKVKAKETLYGISKKYGVSIDLIKEANPFLNEGLKIGQELRILTSIDRKEKLLQKTKKNQAVGNNLNTLSTIDKFTKLDGQVKDESKQEKKSEELVLKSDTMIKHRVLKGETLYSISKRYMIPMKELYAHNKIPRKGISIGDVVNIPVVMDNGVEVEVRKLPKQDEILIDSTCTFKKKDSYKVVYLLPFYLDKLIPDSTNQREIAFRDKVTDLSADFYVGANIALDSLKNLGLNLNVDFIDTKGDTSVVSSVLDSLENEDVDLVIGPLFPNTVEMVANWCFLKKVKMVCPVSTDTKVLKNNPEVQIAIASDFVLMEESAKYIVERLNQTKEMLVLVKPKEAVDILKYEYFRTYIKDLLTGSEVKINETTLEDYKMFVQKGIKILFFVPVSDEPTSLSFISDLISVATNLNGDITVFGTKEWLTFQSMNGAYRNKFNFHFASPNDFNFKYDETVELAKKIRLKYELDLTKMSALAYDVTMAYSILYMMNNSIDFNYVLGRYIPLTKGESNGFENHAVEILCQKDFEIFNIKDLEND